jgi:sec-independent protein translocase protein TatB
MFGIGAQELAIILVVALLVFGPKRLPELARTLGRGLAEFRRASSDLRHSVRLDLDDDQHIDGDRQNPHSAMPAVAPATSTEPAPLDTNDPPESVKTSESVESVESDDRRVTPQPITPAPAAPTKTEEEDTPGE